MGWTPSQYMPRYSHHKLLILSSRAFLMSLISASDCTWFLHRAEPHVYAGWWLSLPLWKMMDFVSWDDCSIPNCCWKVIQNSMVPVTTNQAHQAPMAIRDPRGPTGTHGDPRGPTGPVGRSDLSDNPWDPWPGGDIDLGWPGTGTLRPKNPLTCSLKQKMWIISLIILVYLREFMN